MAVPDAGAEAGRRRRHGELTGSRAASRQESRLAPAPGSEELGPGPARLLLTFVPGRIDDFFPEIGRTSLENWPELAQRHDTWIVGPPIDVKGDHRSLSASSV
jgi:hypothetical protein